jgi:hypothetical protein
MVNQYRCSAMSATGMAIMNLRRLRRNGCRMDGRKPIMPLSIGTEDKRGAIIAVRKKPDHKEKKQL